METSTDADRQAARGRDSETAGSRPGSGHLLGMSAESQVPVEVARVEVVGVDGAAGDELDDPQNDAIKEILLWLYRYEQRPPR
jgi:hypothetical protein